MARKKQQVDLIGLVKASDDRNVPVTYANQARIAVTNNEIYIDFILLAPGYKTDDATAKVVQRIVLPMAQGINFMRAFSRMIPFEEVEVKDPPVEDDLQQAVAALPAEQGKDEASA